jgi:hypothetical protein
MLERRLPARPDRLVFRAPPFWGACRQFVDRRAIR